MSLMDLHTIPGKISTLFAAHYPETDKVLLLDAGCAMDYDTTLSYLEEQNMAPPNLVVVTHAHPDHAGAAYKWKEHGIPLVAPRGINQWYTGVTGWLQHRIDLGLTRFVEMKSSRNKSEAYTISSFLRGVASPSRSLHYPRSLTYDEELPVPDPLSLHIERPEKEEEGDVILPLHEDFSDWQVVAVPGHTDHQVALFHVTSGTLYAADTVIHIDNDNDSKSNTCPSEAPQQHGLHSPLHVDFPLLHSKSLERLARLPVQRLLLAHGGVLHSKAGTGFERSFMKLASKSRNASYQVPSKLGGWKSLAYAALTLPTRFGKNSIRRALVHH